MNIGKLKILVTGGRTGLMMMMLVTRGRGGIAVLRGARCQALHGAKDQHEREQNRELNAPNRHHSRS